MYLDYGVATVAFVITWLILAWITSIADTTQWAIMSVIAVISVLVCYPVTRSAWTVLVYISGGIERPRLKMVRGGRA